MGRNGKINKFVLYKSSLSPLQKKYDEFSPLNIHLYKWLEKKNDLSLLLKWEKKFKASICIFIILLRITFNLHLLKKKIFFSKQYMQKSHIFFSSLPIFGFLISNLHAEFNLQTLKKKLHI